LYHPDRNIGKESDITAKFQAIQSAHEVLTDPTERARYDESRSRYRYTSASAFRTQTRGNPYSSYGAEYPRPPKAPPYRSKQNPPPSAGAARYAGFQTPKQPPTAAAQEGAEARKSTFHAWESMKGHTKSSSSTRPGPGSTWSTPKAVPKEYTPQSGREESNSYRHAPPPRPKPSYDEFRSAQSSGSSSFYTRPPSTSAPRKNGFMPSNPDADEPAAGKGSYFTTRSNRTVPDPPPPRDVPSYDDIPPVNHSTRPSVNTSDPLRQFRETEEASFEPRLSTPYANSGGEKFDPFDTANLNRSKSTREGVPSTEPRKHVPRTGSDPNLPSPRDSDTLKPAAPTSPSPDSSSNSEKGPEIPIRPQRPRVFAKTRRPTPTREQQETTTTEETQSQRKPSNLSTFQQWMRENPNARFSVNDFASDVPTTTSSPEKEEPTAESKAESKIEPNAESKIESNAEPKAEPKPEPKVKTKSESSMYGKSSTYPLLDRKERIRLVKRATVSGAPLNPHPLSFSTRMQDARREYHPDGSLTLGSNLNVPPSGVSTVSVGAMKFSQADVLDEISSNIPAPARTLSTFEAVQRSLVDQLLSNKQQAETLGMKGSFHLSRSSHGLSVPLDLGKPIVAEIGSAVKPGFANKCQSTSLSREPRSSLIAKLSAQANLKPETSFSMNLDDQTFSPTHPTGFQRASADNINTKFSSEEWHGKFQAGGDYFVPEKKTTQVPLRSRSRAQSNSKVRGRSPVKIRPVDPKLFSAAKPDAETPIESPGGTKFSAQEWEQTFKPQTFAPPAFPSPIKPSVPPRLGSRKPKFPISKPTVGSAAIVVSSDDESSDEKPLFAGRAGKVPQTPATGSSSPDAMDVDTPPLAAEPPSQSSPGANGKLKINTEPLKRAAAPSQSPVDADTLKVDFEDLKIQDILSSLDLPKPPPAPKYSTEGHHTPMAQGIYLSAFTAYMADWDLFSKRMMLHIIARKNQNDSLASNRWESSQGLDIYRRGLKEDGAVLSHWVAAMAAHDQAMKDYAIHKERFSMSENRERERPRKKTH
jgi:curved DNA-binding protein CbpA